MTGLARKKIAVGELQLGQPATPVFFRSDVYEIEAAAEVDALLAQADAAAAVFGLEFQQQQLGQMQQSKRIYSKPIKGCQSV